MTKLEMLSLLVSAIESNPKFLIRLKLNEDQRSLVSQLKPVLKTVGHWCSDDYNGSVVIFKGLG